MKHSLKKWNSWFVTLCYFLLYGRGIQLYIHRSVFFRLFSFEGYCEIFSTVPRGVGGSLVIYFIYCSVYMLIPDPLIYSPLPFPFWSPQACLCLWIYFCCVGYVNLWGFPGSSHTKESALPGQRPWFDPWVGTIPWRRKWQPTPVFLPGESLGQRSLAGYSPWGCKESDTTEQLTH